MNKFDITFRYVKRSRKLSLYQMNILKYLVRANKYKNNQQLMINIISYNRERVT